MYNKKDPRVITLKQMLERKSMRSLIEEAMRLDYSDTKGLLKIDEGDAGHWRKVLKKSPLSIRYLIDKEGSIAGYWHFVAPTQGMYAEILKGRLVDGHIKADQIHSLSRPGTYNLYSIERLLVPELRDGKAIKILYNSFYDAIEAMAKRGVLFQNYCTNAYTRDGLKLVKRCGLRYVTRNRSKGSIYAMDFYHFLLKNTGQRRKLIGLYRKAKLDGTLGI